MMKLVTGIPTAMMYEHITDKLDQEVIDSWYKDRVKLLKEYRDDINYQNWNDVGSLRSRMKYCLAHYNTEFDSESNSPLFYIIFARKYFEQAMDEFNAHMNTTKVSIVATTPCWIEEYETKFHDKRYKVLYEEEDRPVEAEEIGLYLIKIQPSDDLALGARFVCNYITMVYVRLYCLGEPYMHYGRQYNPEVDGSLAEYVIGISNRKDDGDRLVDIHSLTNCYDVAVDDLWLLGDVEVMNKVFWDSEDIYTHFKRGGDNKQTYQMQFLREFRLTGKIRPMPNPEAEHIEGDGAPEWLDMVEHDNDDDDDDDNGPDDDAEYGNIYNKGDYIVPSRECIAMYMELGEKLILAKVLYQENDEEVEIEILAHADRDYVGYCTTVESKYYDLANPALVARFQRGAILNAPDPLQQYEPEPPHKFDVGSWITGTEDSNRRYSITNSKMYIGEVIARGYAGSIEVRILYHANDEYEGRSETVDEKYFMLADLDVVNAYKKKMKVDAEPDDFEPNVQHFLKRRGYGHYDLRRYNGEVVKDKRFGLRVLRNKPIVGDYLVGKPGNGYEYTTDKEICNVISVDNYAGLVKVKIVHSLNRPWYVGKEYSVEPEKFYNVLYR
jgi:hypothetical protein